MGDMRGGRLAVCRAPGRRKWLGIPEGVCDQGDKNKAFEACKIIMAVNTGNIKYRHASNFTHKWQVFDMYRGVCLALSTVGEVRQL